MSFKVNHSRLMVPIVSQYRAEQNLMKAKIPRAPLDYSDDDYDPPQVIPEEASQSQRTVSRRSGQYTITAPEELPSSQEAASSQEQEPTPSQVQEVTSSQDFPSIDRDLEIS
ncbi:hypothetical protein EC957_008648 [Mortierella hygrophila]|uniref:Uncharacterized protein n=1 Tax=Mortierella hygrophila TaxID=979708 RepID=A0A9P6FBZ9_9FUNG|nr:hypothetical protein EC957_008648 [Mortierella hygrophila]